MLNQTPPYDTQSLSQFSEDNAAALRHIARTRKPLLIARKGKAAAILLSPQAYDELADAADLAHSTQAIRQSLQEYRAGKGRVAEPVLAKLEAKYRKLASRRK